MASNPKPSFYIQNTDEIKKVFDKFDSNGDGKISGGELANVLKSLGSEISTEEVNRMMEEIDTDLDGFISFDEFAEFCRGSCDSGDSDGGAKELREAFEMYDTDKNGLISAAELHMVLNRLGEKCSVQDCGRMIGSVDSDGDGNVNFEEFKKMMSNTNSSSQ